MFVKPDWRFAEGKKLILYDPKESVVAFLQSKRVDFKIIDRLSQWSGEPGDMLLVGANALTTEDFSLLRNKLESGGRVIVLDHEQFFDFTSLRLEAPETEQISHAAVVSGTQYNGMMEGLTDEDLRFWNTKDEDLLVWYKGIRLPQRGNFRIYTRGGSGAKPEESGLVEAAVGLGSVVFVQMNLSRALGHDPAADRLLANLLKKPGGFKYRPAAVIGQDNFVNALLGKIGLVAARLENAEQLAPYRILFLDAAKLPEVSGDKLRDWIRQGGTLLLPNIRPENKGSLDSLLEKEVKIDEMAQDRAYILQDIDALTGLSHGDFFWTAGKSGDNRHIKAADLSKTQKPGPTQTGHFALSGEAIVPWLHPAYLAETKIGEGRIILCTLRLFDYPVAETSRVLSMISTNLGVRLQPGSSAAMDPAKAAAQYRYETISLTGKVKAIQSLPELKDLPNGRRQFQGVTFEIPGSQAGSVMSLDGETKDIPVKKRLDRLVFLYGSLDGEKGFRSRAKLRV